MYICACEYERRKPQFIFSTTKLISNGIARPNLYGGVVYRDRKFRYDRVKLTHTLNKIILNGYDFNTVTKSLNIVFIGINVNFVISRLKPY